MEKKLIVRIVPCLLAADATAGESVSIERVEQREARGPCDFGLDGSDTGSDIYVYL